MQIGFAVVSPKRSLLITSLALGLVMPLAACAGGPLSDAVERSLAADPALENNSPLFGGSAAAPETPPPPQAQLPVDFPAEIPQYPRAELMAVSRGAVSSGEDTETRWTTADSSDRIRQFYQQRFEEENWQVVQPSAAGNGAEAPDLSSSIVAERDGMRVTVAIAPTPSPQTEPATTEFTLTYSLSSGNVASQPSPVSQPTPSPTTAASPSPQPASPDVESLVQAGAMASGADRGETRRPDQGAIAAQQFADIDQAPEELRPYIADLAQLGVLTPDSAQTSPQTRTAGETAANFRPNDTITRRDYARWLVAANNEIYDNTPAKRIRLGIQTAQPAFQDVPRTDPDFGAIQGLAETGLIPSPLSGDSTVVTFRPDAPLTREDLILWKMPIDLRQTLPNATVEAVQQTWGFQDAARIEPKALRAVLADFQNGDMANIRRAFGYTTLFQPKKTVTRAEAAAVLWYFGYQGEGISARDVLQTPAAAP